MRRFFATILGLVIVITQFGFVFSLQSFASEDKNGIEVLTEASDTSSSISKSNLLLDTESQMQSAKVRQKARINKLAKKSYRSDEAIEIKVDNPENINLTITDPTGKVVDTDLDIENKSGSKIIEVNPPKKLRPGRYTVEVTDSSGTSLKQDFIWGVLALNTPSDVYEVGERVDFQIAVLDERGFMVCDALVNLDIKDPRGIVTRLSTEDKSIVITEQCLKKTMSLTPDYKANFTPDLAGNYVFTLSAKTVNGDYSINSQLEVSDKKPFKVTRVSPTRLYPPVTYPVRIEIEAKEDFRGIVTETVPDDFQILNSESGLSFESIKKVSSNKSEEDSSIEKVLGTSVISLGRPFRGYFPLTQGFGSLLTDPILKKKYIQFGLIGHDGADFALPMNTPVVSADDGKIVLAKEDSTYGTTIVIEHSWGRSYYGHLNKLEKLEGTQVAKGEVIGLSGNTGLSTGPHLHFGIKLSQNDISNGYYGKINPLPYLGIESSAYVDESMQILSWEVDVKKGETVSLGYRFVSPNISPQFYTFGPVKFFKDKNFNIAEEVNFGFSEPAAIEEEEEILTTEDVDATNSASFGDDQINPSNYEFYYQENRTWQLAVDSQSTVDADVSVDSQNHSNNNSSTVFISNLTGYTFYSDSDGICKYAKTNDGGISWDSPISIDDTNQTDCMSPVVWYDQWTPGDNSGELIHIAMKDSGDDDIWYIALDTSDDSYTGSIVSITSSPAVSKSNSFSYDKNRLSITKATDEAIYVGVHDDIESYVIKCLGSCQTASNWVDESPIMINNEDSDLLLMPISNSDLVAIRQNILDKDIEYATYDQSLDSWSIWSDIDSNYGGENSSYKAHISATLNKTNNKIYLVYRANTDNLGTDDEIRSAVFDSGAWTGKSKIVDSSSDGVRSNLGVTGQTISLDENSGALYVIYAARTNPTATSSGNIYFRKSTNDMNSFEEASNSMSNGIVDLKGVSSNLMSPERIYAIWHDDDNNSNEPLYGETIIDLLTEIKPEMLLRHGRYSSVDGKLHPFIF